MKAPARPTETAPRIEEPRMAPRRTRVVIRRVEPWSVLKFSLLFYFCLMLVFLLAFLILYWMLGLLGVLDSTADLLGGLLGDKSFRINGAWIFSRLFLIGVIGVVIWSLVNLFVAVLYNLISDLVGGIQVTLGERR